MDSVSMEKATLVRQYELLLMHRHRFVLSDAIASIHAVLFALQDVESLLHTTNHSREKSGHTTSSRSLHPRHHHRDATYADIMDSIAERLALLTSQVPVFLGDSELLAFCRELRSFAHHPDLESFWNLPMTSQEKRVTENLTAGLMKTLESKRLQLERVVVDVMPTAVVLRKKRNHLIQLVDESLELLEKARTAQSEQFEKKKKRLMVRFQDALHDPTLQEIKQLELEVDTIEKEMAALLQPHIEISRTVTTANANVPSGGEFDEAERNEIDGFVRLALQIADETVAFGSCLADVSSFLRRLTLFERAATTDAFIVWKSALKLNFDGSLDRELFHAYITDWTDKKTLREELLASNQYEEASQHVAQLKDQILQAQTAIQSSRKNVVLDDVIEQKLSAQIARVFEDESGDTPQIYRLLG